MNLSLYCTRERGENHWLPPGLAAGVRRSPARSGLPTGVDGCDVEGWLGLGGSISMAAAPRLLLRACRRPRSAAGRRSAPGARSRARCWAGRPRPAVRQRRGVRCRPPATRAPIGDGGRCRGLGASPRPQLGCARAAAPQLPGPAMPARRGKAQAGRSAGRRPRMNPPRSDPGAAPQLAWRGPLAAPCSWHALTAAAAMRAGAPADRAAGCGAPGGGDGGAARGSAGWRVAGNKSTSAPAAAPGSAAACACSALPSASGGLAEARAGSAREATRACPAAPCCQCD
jgi:hypothetical protein